MKYHLYRTWIQYTKRYHSVEWVHANVGNFGGDPERITLWGQSAGAASSSVYPYGYPEDPLISGVIADSGSPSIITNSDTAHTNFTFIAGLLGCGNLSANKELSCMRKVPAQALENALSYYSGNGTKPSVSFTPVVDDKTIFANYTQRILDGKISKTVSSFHHSHNTHYWNTKYS